MTRDELIASVVGKSNGWTKKGGVPIPIGWEVAKRRAPGVMCTWRHCDNSWGDADSSGKLDPGMIYIRPIPKRKKAKPVAAFSQPDPAPPAVTPGQIYTTSPFGSITPDEEAHLTAELKRYREEIKVGDWAASNDDVMFRVSGFDEDGDLLDKDGDAWFKSGCVKIPPSHYPALEAAMAAAKGAKS